jgi:hypothetical protein
MDGFWDAEVKFLHNRRKFITTFQPKPLSLLGLSFEVRLLREDCPDVGPAGILFGTFLEKHKSAGNTALPYGANV